MIDEHKTSNPSQQINVFESDNAAMESSCSKSQVNELHQPIKLPDNAKDSCIECFRLLHLYIKVLFAQPGYLGGYNRAFATLFGQNVETFTVKMTLYLDQLQQQLEKGEFFEGRSIAAFCVINNQLQAFIYSRFTEEFDHESQMIKQCFVNYTGIEVDVFRVKLLKLMGNVKEYIEERTHHKLKFEDKVKTCEVQSSDGIVDSGKTSDVGLMVTEGRGSETDKLDTTNSSMTHVTHDVEAYISPVKEHVSCAKVLELYDMVDEQKIPNEVQQTNVVESDTADMGNSNVIPYDQYVKHKVASVVQSSASSVLNDDYVLHENTAFIPDDSLTTRLNILKDQVTIYEQRAKFELTEREQKMDMQMRVLVTERNKKEEIFKIDLESLKKQLDQSVKQKQKIHKSMITQKLDFQKKETKLLNDFSCLKTLKNKLEDKLYTQGQTIQTTQMIQKHRKLSDEHSERT
jgi:hypothetical protein